MFCLSGLRLGAVLLTAILTLGVGAVAEGGKFNRKIKIGDPAPSYTGLPGVDGKSHSLADEKDKDVVVLVITCNQCPVATAYEKRIMDFSKKYGGPESKVAVVAINVNSDAEDSLPNMIVRAQERGFSFPYLYDDSQKIGRALGATVTPEFFVLDKNRKVVYMGGMDNGVNPNNVTANYLVPAVEAALKGVAPTISETAARGCNILYQRAAKSKLEQVELKAVKLAQLQDAIKAQAGKIVVMDVWGTFCVPCKKEFPRLVKLHERFAKDGLVCMSLSIDDKEDRDAALEFLKSRHAAFANFIMDEPAMVWQEHFLLKGVPAVFIWDRAGKQVARFDGDDPDNQFTYADVDKKVAALLQAK